MWVVGRLCQIKIEAPENSVYYGMPIEVDQGKMSGYMPVYERYADAIEENSGCPVWEIKMKEEGR